MYDSKLLILDLDGTLITSKKYDITDNKETKLQTFVVVDDYDNEHLIKKRPGLDEFLEKVSERYDIGVWTASSSDYAIPICLELFKKSGLDFIHCRERCVMEYKLGELTAVKKPIKTLFKGSDSDLFGMHNTLVLDDTPTTYMDNIENAIPIKSWYGDENDKELSKTLLLIQCRMSLEDVRIARKPAKNA